MREPRNLQRIFSRLRWFFMFATTLSIVSCSTEPITSPRVYGPAIVFVRDTGILGIACSYDVYIDGKMIGQLGAGESISKPVKNGRHRVAIENVTLACPSIKMSKVIEVLGAPVVLRVGVTSTLQTIFDQVE